MTVKNVFPSLGRVSLAYRLLIALFWAQFQVEVLLCVMRQTRGSILQQLEVKDYNDHLFSLKTGIT